MDRGAWQAAVHGVAESEMTEVTLAHQPYGNSITLVSLNPQDRLLFYGEGK